MDFDKNTSVGYLINTLARVFARELQSGITPLGIVTGQFPILLELWEKEGQTQRELLAKLNIEQATLANTLTRMERDKLITRTKHPTDARAQQIWLTEKTKSIKPEALATAATINTRSLRNLEPAEQDQLIALMHKVIGNLSRQQG